MTEQQRKALKELDAALCKATESGLLDILVSDVHPDYINTFCDEVRRMLDAIQ